MMFEELADTEPDFWEFLAHAQTVCTRLSFPPLPLGTRQRGWNSLFIEMAIATCHYKRLFFIM